MGGLSRKLPGQRNNKCLKKWQFSDIGTFKGLANLVVWLCITPIPKSMTPFGLSKKAANGLKQRPKMNGVLDFPNLPYFTDGDVKLTQSDAILRHLGRKHGLYGGSEKQAGHIDMLIDTAKDIKMALIMPNVVMKNLEEKKAEVITAQDAKFKQLSEFLGGKSFLAGNDVTIADFAMYDALKWFQELDSSLISKHSNLCEYFERFENVPKVKSFLNGPGYMKNFFPPFASFGGNRA